MAANKPSACSARSVTSIVIASAASWPLRSMMRKAHLAGRHAFKIVPGDAQLLFDRAILFLELLAEILDERLHDLVVEHLAELGLVPALFEFGRSGDRYVALGGARQAARRLAARPRPRGQQRHERGSTSEQTKPSRNGCQCESSCRKIKLGCREFDMP